MPEISPFMGSATDTIGEDTSDSQGTTITAAASTNTKGSYTTVVASTAFETDWVTVFLGPPSASADYLVDIAVGGAGSEVVILSNLQISTKASETNRAYLVPIRIPSGTRLSARCQCTTASGTIDVAILYNATGWLGPKSLTNCTTYGANTADSGATGLDPGGTANTKGGWTQIVASTTSATRAMMVVLGDRNNNAMTSCSWLLDIGVGASTAEQILFTLCFRAGLTNDDIWPNVFGPIWINLPVGVRLAGNVQCNITDATDRLIDVSLLCLD